MRCKACNSILSRNDLSVDDELCRHCLDSIPEEILISSQIIQGEENNEDLYDDGSTV